MRAVLIAIQTEPAVLVYGAIVFLLRFALLIPTSKWKNHGSLGANALIADGSLTTIRAA